MNGPNLSTSARVAALVVGLVVGASGSALACTCVPTSFETEYANTSHVFTAHKIGSHEAPPEYRDMHVEVLAVHAVWKGEVTAIVEVLTGNYDGNCGLNLVEDLEYLVFAHGLEGLLFTSTCSRTWSYPPGNEIWTLLGPPVVTPANHATWGAVKSIYRR